MKKDKQIIVRVNDELKNSFDLFCKKNGYSPSKRLRILIEMDIQNNNKRLEDDERRKEII